MESTKPGHQEYAEAHTSPEGTLLSKINRDTHVNLLMPRMLSGHHQGRLLAMLSKMIQPTYVLEVGTFTGYSALCLAEGLKDEGKIVTIDINEELEKRARKFFAQSAFNSLIDYRIGNALDIIPDLPDGIDLVFLDADKEHYPEYYELVIDKMKPGGYLLADNVLWGGKVLMADDKLDKDTLAIKKFNEQVQHDSRVENVMLPIRDGMMVVRKQVDL